MQGKKLLAQGNKIFWQGKNLLKKSHIAISHYGNMFSQTRFLLLSTIYLMIFLQMVTKYCIMIYQKFRVLRALPSSSCRGPFGPPSSGIIFLVPFLATKEILAPHANNPIMQRRSIWSFRHLEGQNPSIISEDIGRARRVQHFWRSRRRSQIGSNRIGGVQLAQGM